MDRPAWEIRDAARRAVVALKSEGARVRVDGREWLELPGYVARLSLERAIASEAEAREIAGRLDADLLSAFEAEAADYREHSRVLATLLSGEELTSRRIVSVLPPPRCPTAVQVLRRDEVVHVLGFMRSERAVPLLPLDLLNHLWAVGEALPAEDRLDRVRLTLLVGSLHLEVE